MAERNKKKYSYISESEADKSGLSPRLIELTTLYADGPRSGVFTYMITGERSLTSDPSFSAKYKK